eukprot:365006-Chlamydomonas_euryale.AAC.8
MQQFGTCSHRRAARLAAPFCQPYTPFAGDVQGMKKVRVRVTGNHRELQGVTGRLHICLPIYSRKFSIAAQKCELKVLCLEVHLVPFSLQPAFTVLQICGREAYETAQLADNVCKQLRRFCKCPVHVML